MAISQITAGSIADGTVVASDIADGTITDAKIVGVANTKITGVLNTSQIADSAITTAKIAAGAVVTADIADANVTNDKIVSVANTKITGVLTASQLANTAVTAGVYGGSSNSALITIDSQGRITAASNVSAGGGSLQAELFTSPGTWTKPSTVTQVRVTVIAGGSGAGLNGNPGFLGGTGGSSSFGSLISATGASASPGPAGGTPGSGTVTTGTAIKTGTIYSPIPYVAPAVPAFYPTLFSSISGISGTVIASGLGGSPTYPTSGSVMAGAAGSNGNPYYSTATGGLAIGICPVSAPVAVTVGTGGAFNPGVGNLSSGSGVGGAVLVEWVG